MTIQFPTSRVAFGLGWLAAVVITLASCGPALIMQSAQDVSFPTGVHSTFTYAAIPGEVYTVVVGNPFQDTKSTVDAVVTTAMIGSHYGPYTRFSTEPGPRARTDFRIVWMFDPPLAMENRRLCGDIASLPAATAVPDRLSVRVAFCGQADMLSWVWASMPRVATANDPAFASLIANSMWQLIPDRDILSDSTLFD